MASIDRPKPAGAGGPGYGPTRRGFLRGIGGAAAAALIPNGGLNTWAEDSKYIHYLNQDKGVLEVSNWWARQCEMLPCFSGIKWDGYNERIFHTDLGGTPVVLHLWKGKCQKFVGSKDFPGGNGAELGIYRVRDETWVAEHAAAAATAKGNLWSIAPPLGFFALLQAHWEVGKYKAEQWYPAPELGAKLKFRLSSPYTGNTLFETPETTDYWCTGWMEDDPYKAWEKDNGDDKQHLHPEGLRMQYWVDGHEYVWQHESTYSKAAFKAHDGVHYVSARPSRGVTADAGECKAWETFHLLVQAKHGVEDFRFGHVESGSSIYVYSNEPNAGFLSGESTGRLGISPNMDRWERFEIQKIGGSDKKIRNGDKVALVSVSRKWWVTAEGGGGREMNCNRDKREDWETFTIHEK